LPSGLFFIYYKCIKDPLSNAAKEGSMKPWEIYLWFASE
jgi:hypothetical protein